MSKDRSDRIYFSQRGIVNLPLGGQDRQLRFRTHEISELEERMGKGIMSLLNEDQLGLKFLKNAIIVGVAHEFIGKRGKQKQTLTDKLVSRWMDDCDGVDGRLTFEELTETVLKAVVGGMPGGDRYIEDMERGADEAEEAERAGSDGNPREADHI